MSLPRIYSTVGLYYTFTNILLDLGMTGEKEQKQEWDAKTLCTPCMYVYNSITLPTVIVYDYREGHGMIIGNC